MSIHSVLLDRTVMPYQLCRQPSQTALAESREFDSRRSTNKLSLSPREILNSSSRYVVVREPVSSRGAGNVMGPRRNLSNTTSTRLRVAGCRMSTAFVMPYRLRVLRSKLATSMLCSGGVRTCRPWTILAGDRSARGIHHDQFQAAEAKSLPCKLRIEPAELEHLAISASEHPERMASSKRLPV